VKDLTAREHRAFLDNKDTTRGTNGGKKTESIKGVGTKLSNISNIKTVPLGFLMLMTSQLLSVILFLMDSHLLSVLIPLIFQQRTFQE
jgi:hypothetical protein